MLLDQRGWLHSEQKELISNISNVVESVLPENMLF